MKVAVSSQVSLRNSLGQFRADCAKAATQTIERAVSQGAEISRSKAPVGAKPDPRTPMLRESIDYAVLSRNSGHWYASARHALHQEFGTGPHPITGNPYLNFYWSEEGRDWIPGLHGAPDIVMHPGHGPQPYLRPAYNQIMNRIMAIARRYYPG